MFEQYIMVEITTVNVLLIIFVPSTSLLVLGFLFTTFKKCCKDCVLFFAAESLGEERGMGCILDTCGIEPEEAVDTPGPKIFTKVTDMINETSPGGKHHIIHVTEAALATGLLCVKLPKNVRFVVHD
jgi:hypothetical protein